jgi:NADH-quinone oxidoreductase subunit E
MRKPRIPKLHERDDLKLIYGVGPSLEKMLYRLGIYWFKQIAQWTDKDIDRVDAKLEQFHGRIRRENWVTSAKEEHFKKYGERL